MTTRLGSFLAVRWSGFGAFAADASVAGIESKLASFGRACDEAVAPGQGELLANPVKDSGDRRVYSFQSSSAALEAADRMRRRLEEDGFSAAIGLHAGECQDRGETWIGVALREVRDLARCAAAGEVLVSEVFRLTLSDTREDFQRRDVPVELAGNAWSVYLWPAAGAGG